MCINILPYKKMFLSLPLAGAIAGLTGCDSPVDEAACDSPAVLIAVEQQLRTENDAQGEGASLLSRFKTLGTSDGLLAVKGGTEKSRDGASGELTCSVQAVFAPEARPDQMLSADVLYTMVKQAKRIVAQITHTSEHIKPEQINAVSSTNGELSDDDYAAVSGDDLLYIFVAQAGHVMSDREKLNLFSEKWRQEADAAAKEALGGDELVRINAALSRYENLKNIRFYANAPHNEAGMLSLTAHYDINPTYDADRQAFTVAGDFCAAAPSDWQREFRGVRLALSQVSQACELPVSPADAPALATRFDDPNVVQVSTAVFARIVNVEPDINRINITIDRQQAQVNIKTPGETDTILQADFK